MCDTVHKTKEELEEEYIDDLQTVLYDANLKQKDVDDLKTVTLHQLSQAYSSQDIFVVIRTLSALNDYAKEHH